MKTEFLSPVGRLVQGDFITPQTTNKSGQPLVDKKGQPTKKWFAALAFRKDDPQFPPFYQLILQTARAAFPALFDAQGNCTHPKFAFKVIDGDGRDDDGKPNANKPGFAGHWVVKFGSGFAPRCYYMGRHSPTDQITDPKQLPRGLYYRIGGSIEGNGDTSKPGVYVNVGLVELCGGSPSDIITSGPDASQVFAQAAVLPQGVGAVAMGALPGAQPQGLPGMAAPAVGNGLPGMPIGVPPMATPAQLPGMNGPASLGAAVPQVGSFQGGALPMAGSPAGAMLGMVAPAMGALPGMPGMQPAAQVPVQPNPAFLNGPQVGGSLPGLAPAQMPIVPATPQVTAKAQGMSYEQLRAAGHDDATLRAHGYIL